MAVLNPGTLSIRWKARLNSLLRAGSSNKPADIGGQFYKKMTIREANGKTMQLLSDTKAKYIETILFLDLEQQINAFSTEQQTLEAFNRFGYVFF